MEKRMQINGLSRVFWAVGFPELHSTFPWGILRCPLPLLDWKVDFCCLLRREHIEKRQWKKAQVMPWLKRTSSGQATKEMSWFRVALHPWKPKLRLNLFNLVKLSMMILSWTTSLARTCWTTLLFRHPSPLHPLPHPPLFPHGDLQPPEGMETQPRHTLTLPYKTPTG